MMKFSIFRALCGTTLWGFMLPLGAQAVLETQGSIHTLKNEQVSYSFDQNKFYHLAAVKFQKQPVNLKGFMLNYMLCDGNWFNEFHPAPRYRMTNYQHKLVKLPDGVKLQVTAAGPEMAIQRNYTLKHHSPELTVEVRLDFPKQHELRWIYLVNSTISGTAELIRLDNQLVNGIPKTWLKSFDHPFFDASGRNVVLGNYPIKSWLNLPLTGIYEKSTDRGAIVMINPEKSRRLFRCGQSKKSGYIMISPTTFSECKQGEYLYTSFQYIPFAGRPENLAAAQIKNWIAQLSRHDLALQFHDTAQLVAAQKDFDLWQDLPDNKIYRDRRAPQKIQRTVKLYAARGEAESFQLALRPRQELKQVSLKFSPLRSGSATIPAAQLQWSAVGFQKAERYCGFYFSEIPGEHPDTLLGNQPIRCPAHLTQPFFITLAVPPTAQPGHYRGTVEVWDGARQLFALPLQVRVWSFDLTQHNLTFAMDFWWRYKNYPPQVQKQMTDQTDEIVINHRGGKRWINKPATRWDAQGNVKSINFQNFDRDMEKFLHVYKHKTIISSVFMLGWGHRPRNNYFGKKEEILTPRWQKKLLSFARALNQHLQDKNWNDKIVFDLFDEPDKEYYSLLNATVKLLRSVNPQWRFTFAGSYTPELSQSINYWNVTMSGWIACRPAMIRKIRQAGQEITVYNPPYYEYTQPLTYIRSNCYWLWCNFLDYIYQWVVNCWAERGYTGQDNYRCASWVAPGKDRVLSTLRMAITREGIEDYEYLTLLRNKLPRLRQTHPALARETQQLLNQVSRIITIDRRDDQDKISQNPADYARFHRDMGAMLERIYRATKK